MSQLETTILEWRRRMLAAGITAPVPLEELEIHLRDNVAALTSQGMEELRAVETAARQIGSGLLIQSEFNKATQEKTMKRMFIIGAGIIGVLVGMALVMPALAQYRHEGAMTQNEAWLLLLGAALTLGGFGATVGGVRKHAS